LLNVLGSSRFAQIGDPRRVAGEFGNSATVVRRHYLELVTASGAQSWFGATPSAMANNADIRAHPGQYNGT